MDRLFFAATVTLVFLIGCASVELSPQQRRGIQMRTFTNSSYDNVFRAVKTVLQDEGYVIKNQDMAGGLILATIQKSEKKGLFSSLLSSRDTASLGEIYEVSINLEKINETTTETRLAIQKVENFKGGGQKGEVILEPETYNVFYQKVRVEVERRKASGRS